MKQPLNRRTRSAAVAIVVLAIAGAACAAETNWAWIEGAIASRFPEVGSIETHELAEAVAESAESGAVRPLILDAREPVEYDVGHIPGAVRAQTVDQARTAIRGRAPGQPVVVYCSVGYRSAELVDQLQDAGIENVKNLRGSIFQWANEGRPMVSADGPTTAVHPYNRTWGKLLDRTHWPDDWAEAGR